MTVLIDRDGDPVELAPGRGDLRGSSTPLEEWFGSLGARGAVRLVGGKTVSYARLFAEQPWIGAAVMRMLTWAVRVPLKAYRRDGDDRRRLRPDDHPLAAALLTPWERAGQAQLVQAFLGPVLVHGNAVVGVDEGRSGALRFDAFDWRTLAPIKAGARQIAGWTVREDGDEREVSADHSIHVSWWSPLGPTGVSPLRQLGTTVRIEDAAQRWARATFENGARPPSAVQADKEFLGLDPTERQQLLAQLRADLDTIYAGPENAGRPALLPPGLEWNSVGHTAVEAELIDQRKVNREEVAAVYQIPPPMMGILDRATYSNITTMREMAYTDALGPPLVLIEQAITAQLVRNLLREPDIFVEFDFGVVLRGDRLKEIQALREGIASAIYTPNEARGALNMAASDEEGMDAFYLPTNNLQPVDRDAADGGEGLGDLSLAAQRFGQAIRNGVMSQEEARGLLGLEGPAPPNPNDEPQEDPA
ncbi:phage portal protein [Miltoncostaea marina]|uniref:phage portal protein n=1 Tax=Miltoncostaea marina TaxID=2843215 RepID=UPI001C3D7410|nr:phage portal protein [Miltoncostaea marina]